MPFFRKSAPPPTNLLLRELDGRHRELQERMARIETALERLAHAPQNVTIEQLHIHHPVLERLEYRLDRLDIEQLSGSLNLGNNFGARFGEAGVPCKPASGGGTTGRAGDVPGGSAEPRAGSGAGLSRTPTGYRFKTD